MDKLLIEIEELKDKARTLGVPHYFDGLSDNEIISLGLYYYGKHVEEYVEDIKEAMEL